MSENKTILQDAGKAAVDLFRKVPRRQLREKAEQVMTGLLTYPTLEHGDRYVMVSEVFNGYIEVAFQKNTSYQADGYQMLLIGALFAVSSEAERKIIFGLLMQNQDHVCRKGFRWLTSKGVMGTGISVVNDQSGSVESWSTSSSSPSSSTSSSSSSSSSATTS